MEVDDVFDENYEYNCPQFVDFSVPPPNDDSADTWFDFDHENGKQINFEIDPDTCISQECREQEIPESSKPAPSPRHQDISPVSPKCCSEQEVAVELTCNLHNADDEVNTEEPMAEENAHVECETADAVNEHMITADDARKVVVVMADEKEAAQDKQVDVEEQIANNTEDISDTKIAENEEKIIRDENEEPNKIDETEEVTALLTRSQDNSKPETTEATNTENISTVSMIEIPSNAETSFTDAPVTSSMNNAPKNIVTSWNSSDSNKCTSDDASTTKRAKPVTKRLTRSLSNDTGLKRSVGNSNTQRRSLRIQSQRSTESPVSKRRRILDRSQSRRSAKRETQIVESKPSAKRETQIVESKPFVPKLTMPTTPTFMKRNNNKPGTQFKSTEQLEMETIAMFRKQLAERKKQSQASYKKMQESTGCRSVKAVIPPTKPEEFKFETDNRIKPHAMETRQDKAFEESLRNCGDAFAKFSRGPTVPKPFKLTESRKRKINDGDTSWSKGASFTSVATQINLFHNKTPQRYHSRRSGDQQRDIPASKEAVQKPKLTCPKTPNFECKNRKRPITVQSAADKEEEEVREMQSYKFKANPVNPRVMSNVNIGMKMASHKEPTKPIGFNLELDRRIKEREMQKMADEKEEEHYEFHAKPVSSKMLEGPTGIAPVQRRSLTCPKSPAFALKNRVRVKEDSMIEIEDKTSRVVRANPILHVGVPFRPQLSHKTTESRPFSFEQRDKEIQTRKEAKIQEMYQEEEKARQFKAHPILEPCPVPEKKAKPSTKPQPFKLSVDDQGAKQAEIWSKKMEQELNEQRAKAGAFRAKPAQVLYSEPFVPQKQNRPLTEINEFTLNTDRRAVERDQFEQQKLRRELERREALHEQQLLQEEEEKREVAKMRQEVIHKANPVRHYKPVQVLPSNRQLTEACSPNFSDRFRSRTGQC